MVSIIYVRRNLDVVGISREPKITLATETATAVGAGV